MKNTSTPLLINRFVLLFLLVVSAFVAQAQSVQKHTLPNKKFERKMQKKDAIVLDVRTAEEFKAGHLPNAINIDVQQEDFKQQLANLNKNKMYLIYCKSGRRSEKALKTFFAEGFKKAYHLKEGYVNWQGEKVQ